MNKKLIVRGTIIIAVLFIAAISFMLLKMRDQTTAAVIMQNENFDSLEIKNTDTAKCCSFVNSAGKDEGCYVLKDYDCKFCDVYCKR